MSTPSVGPAPTPGKNFLVNTGDETPGTEGAGIFHDAAEAVEAFGKGNWAEGLINVGATAAGVASFLADPMAGILSAGFGWLIEHVDFLREPLDWLVGDQEALDGMAKTWEAVAGYMKETADDLRDWVKGDTAGWAGKDTEQYRTFGADRADTYAGIAKAAEGISTLVTMCKIVLKVVRDFVRDIIADAVGKLIAICLRWAPAFAAFGAGVAGAVAECVPVAVKWANKALEFCRKLTKAFSNASKLFKKLDDILVNAKTALSKGGDDFVTVLKKSQEADNARRVGEFSWAGMAKGALGEAKKVVVDGVTGIPKEFLPNARVEIAKEWTKLRDWKADYEGDSTGWRTWRDLRQEEVDKQEKKRREAREG